LRGDVLLAVITDDFGTARRRIVVDDGDVPALRREAVRAADGCS